MTRKMTRQWPWGEMGRSSWPLILASQLPMMSTPSLLALGLGRQLLPVLAACLQPSEPPLSDHLCSRLSWPAGVSAVTMLSLPSTGVKGQEQQVPEEPEWLLPWTVMEGMPGTKAGLCGDCSVPGRKLTRTPALALGSGHRMTATALPWQPANSPVPAGLTGLEI